MFSLAKSGEFQFIQVKDKFISGLMALVAARMSGIPFLYGLSYPFPEEYLQKAREKNARYPVFYRVRGEVFRFLLYRVIAERGA